MKTTPLFLSLLLALTLTACGQDKPAEPVAAAPADTAPLAEPPMPMEPTQGVAGHVEGVVAAGGDGHGIYVAKCASCHGVNGEGLVGNPKLAGLSRADIQSRLSDYRGGKKMGPKTVIMAAMAKKLTDAEIAALASYLGE
ncbi:MAG: c-type cytochrome [Pseudomonadota bacterium]|nr:c-type cytochrome [Pseudomonadota bacterium]MDP1904234.1 c-type cytochrome [Pseudomonadota bacterium]